MIQVSKIVPRKRLCGSGNMLLGIDVSQFQGLVPWNSMPSNVDFAFIRATDGLTPDKRWSVNAAQCTKPWGAYHALEPGRDPVESARVFNATTDGRRGRLPPVLDFEVAALGEKASHCIGRALAFRDAVEQEWNRRVIMYVGPAFWLHLAQLGADITPFKRNPLWVAHYTQDYNRLPMVPPPWLLPKAKKTDPDMGWTFWQTSGGQKVSRNGAQLSTGVDVDIDFFDGTMDDLLAL